MAGVFRCLASGRGKASLVVALCVGLLSAGLPLAHGQTPTPGLTPTPGSTPTPASGFADPAFQSTWERTDKFVADGLVQRGYFWGPQPGAIKTEQYAQGQGGARLVQYFDKSRMEINNPNGDRNNPLLRHQRPAHRRAG